MSHLTADDTTMPSPLRVRVNGDTVQLDAPATIATLVAVRQPRPPFAVELNEKVIRRGEYDATPLDDGDVVEIVTLVGGG